MKKLYTILLAVFAFSISFAQTITVKQNGEWHEKATWDKNRVPTNGDKVVIPPGKTVVIENYTSLDNVDIEVLGTLKIYGLIAYLNLDGASTIAVQTYGKIQATNLLGQSIEHNNKRIFGLGEMVGPMMSSVATGYAFKGFSILPVKFASFNVTAKNSAVMVQWSTAEEMGASYFEVQRSLNGTDWSTIGQVKAAGNTNQLTDYSFVDKSKTATKVYYRIKQADTNGKTVYTQVQTVTNAMASQVNIIAYQSKVAVQFAQPVKGKVEVVVVNRAGQVVARQVVENGAGQVVLNNTNNLKGAYFVAVNNGTGITASQQVIL